MYYITINVQYVRYSTGRKIKYFIVYRLIVHTAGGGNGNILQVYTAGAGKGYTLHVHTAGGGNGYFLACKLELFKNPIIDLINKEISAERKRSIT
jgi:hypothetical protein